MFGFGKPANGGHSANSHGRSSSRNSTNSSYSPHTTEQQFSSAESFEAAIDGPPSPERIRAYTEQMKRSSIFGNNSRTHTFSSGTSSFRSGDSSGGASTDNLSLSRKSSVRSNSSSMIQGEKVESHRFGKTIFSRTGRKLRRESSALTNSMSSLTIGLGGLNEETSAKDRYYSKGNGRPGTANSVSPKSRKPLQISAPTNFQHVTNMKQEHLPNLDRTSRMELVSEFTAIRASQAPTNGELRGIRAQDLHFENFSSEAINANEGSMGRRAFRNSASPPRPQRSRSHDMLRSFGSMSAAPPRPPRSPMYPQELPARTSSRTASSVVDYFDPLATTSLGRPITNGGFRRPAPFGLPSPPPPPPTWSEQQENFSDSPISHAVTTPGDEAWPLTASTVESIGAAPLDDVPEEDENTAKRRSKISTANGQLRLSQSVPVLNLMTREPPYERPETGMSTTSGNAFGGIDRIMPETNLSPLSPGFRPNHASWEDDIDYCYEHEAEANCDYEWDRCSLENPSPKNASTPSLRTPEPELEYHLRTSSDRPYNGRFRPSLLVPSPYELPELSPLSSTSAAESDPRTPAFLRPGHLRSPSHASSFKESHGFNLSPTLLIPDDFAAQMNQESLYNDFHQPKDSDYHGASLFPADYSMASPIDESTSSTASYRSSNFSRGSARSSSSTRLSTANRASQESMLLLNAGAISQAHRSVSSTSSLPDLIPSGPRKQTSNVSLTASGVSFPANSAVDEKDDFSAPAPEVPLPAHGPSSTLQMRRKNSLLIEQGIRTQKPAHINHIGNHINLFPMPIQSNDGLSPVAESFVSPARPALNVPEQSHGRKVSAPVLSNSAKEFKGRARSATASGHGKNKSRGSYMLFPPSAATS